MTTPSINTLPQHPQRTDLPSVFEDLADVFVASLPSMVVEINSAISWINTTATTISASVTTASNAATTATTQAGIATTKAGESEAARNEAVSLVLRYQGALNADPSLNKTGGALVAGDWYVNTTSGFIRAYNGSAWVNGIIAITGVESLNGQTGSLTGFTENTATQTLTNKTLTLPILSGTASGTVTGRLGYKSGNLSWGTGSVQRIAVSTNATQTLTSKTISFDSNTLTNVASTGSSQTLTNKDVRKIQVEISSLTNAIAGRTYVFAASTVLNLPSVPTAGMVIGFVNKSGTTDPVINRNGFRIMGLEEDMILNDLNAFGQLMYSNTARGWILV